MYTVSTACILLEGLAKVPVPRPSQKELENMIAEVDADGPGPNTNGDPTGRISIGI